MPARSRIRFRHFRRRSLLLSLDDARRLVDGYVEHYNNIRLNSAVGYITPKDVLAGRQAEIHAEGSEVGGGAKTASDSSAAGCVKRPRR
jgi:hypothetical protein